MRFDPAVPVGIGAVITWLVITLGICFPLVLLLRRFAHFERLIHTLGVELKERVEQLGVEIKLQIDLANILVSIEARMVRVEERLRIGELPPEETTVAPKSSE